MPLLHGIVSNSELKLLTHLPLDEMATILADKDFKCIFLTENDRILIQISLKFVPWNAVNNKPALVQVMACHLFGIWINADPVHWRL